MLPFVGAKIVDPVTFEEVEKGKPGILLSNRTWNDGRIL